MTTEPKEQKGVLITGPSGVIYNIPAKELRDMQYHGRPSKGPS